MWYNVFLRASKQVLLLQGKPEEGFMLIITWHSNNQTDSKKKKIDKDALSADWSINGYLGRSGIVKQSTTFFTFHH